MTESMTHSPYQAADAADEPQTHDAVENSPVVMSVSHVDKVFDVPTEQATGLKQAFINWTRGVRGYREQQVLEDVSFQVHQGDFFGIVGRNGSGKSTLLKLISGIYQPERGTIEIEGKLVPFIELGVGFNPELTGRENVYLNGALLGFSTDEIDAMYDDIVSFAELNDFMDQKLKNYSSGMQVRLAFSVAIKAQGDILVLDEVLAVGDESFQRKCNDFFDEIKQDPSKTVILVTHDMGSIRRYCTKAMMIEDGHVAEIGEPESVAQRYTLANVETQDHELQDSQGDYPNGLNARCPLLKTYAISSPVCRSSDTFRFAVEYQYDEPGDFYLAISLNDISRGGITYDTGAKVLKMDRHGHQTVTFEMSLNLFNNGQFRLITSLRTPSATDPDFTDMVAVAIDANACEFAISDPRNGDYALLSDRAMQIRQVEPSS